MQANACLVFLAFLMLLWLDQVLYSESNTLPNIQPDNSAECKDLLRGKLARGMLSPVTLQEENHKAIAAST